MTEYISRDAAIAYIREQSEECQKAFEELGGESGIYADAYNDLAEDFYRIPAVDAVAVTRCKNCKHSTLPSELTQRYGKPGTLTCHNMHAPSNRRNVGGDDFCSYGEPKDGGYENGDK